MSIMLVTVKETGLKKAINTYTIMSVNALGAVEGEEVGCEVEVLQPKDRIIGINIAEKFEETVRQWQKAYPIYNFPEKAKAKKKPTNKKVVVKKAPAKRAPSKKKVVKRRAR